MFGTSDSKFSNKSEKLLLLTYDQAYLFLGAVNSTNLSTGFLSQSFTAPNSSYSSRMCWLAIVQDETVFRLCAARRLRLGDSVT